MHILNILIKYILILFFVASLAGCKEPNKVEGKYTVWVGSSAFSSGYKTDEYTKSDGMITFKNKITGKTIISPICNVWQIESN